MIEIAKLEDIEEIIKLRLTSQKERFNENITVEYENNIRDYLVKHLNKTVYIIVYKKDNKIVATCGIQIIENFPIATNNGKVGYIFNVYTAKSFRGLGIQNMLLNYCINFGKENNLYKLQLKAVDNISLNIYNKLGFIKDDNTIFKVLN